MAFRNHTPFPALAFEGIDQHSQAFHVIVLRQTLSFASGELVYADEQVPLCEEDEFFGEINQSSVRQESDLCQYKPRCDVIVNASAYAPKATRQFEVRLCVKQPDQARPLPEAPQPLNPWMPVSEIAQYQWRLAVEKTQANPIVGNVLLDKRLIVSGARQWQKKNIATRTVQWLLRCATLTLIRPNPWRLSKAKKITSLPLRYEYAYGGQNRVNVGDKAAKRLNKAERLNAEQCAAHPDCELPSAEQAAAHAVCEANLAGMGFTQAWWLNASKTKVVAAPQISAPQQGLSAKLFWQSLRGKTAAFNPAGFGIRSKTHPERRALLGTVDEAFIQSDACLPADFDFAIWNAAPPDQQIDYLHGNEIIELTNLCAANTPCAKRDLQGNTTLQIKLPQHECFVLVRLLSGEMFQHPLSIDTVMIEPETQTLTLVWRTVLAKDEEVPIRVCEARMHSFAERDQLRAEIQALQAKAVLPMTEYAL